MIDLKKYSKGLQHIGIPTNDIKKTTEFYQSIGFELVNLESNGNEKVAFLRLGNLMVETYQNFQATLCDGAINHISLDVENIEHLFEEVKTAGMTIISNDVECLPFWKHGIKYFIIEGPNNERLEFCQINK